MAGWTDAGKKHVEQIMKDAPADKEWLEVQDTIAIGREVLATSPVTPMCGLPDDKPVRVIRHASDGFPDPLADDLRVIRQLKAEDNVSHPTHYTSHPSGIECIQVTEHMNFNIGNAVKYLWRCDEKGDPIENLRKAAWYIDREIQRRSGETP